MAKLILMKGRLLYGAGCYLVVMQRAAALSYAKHSYMRELNYQVKSLTYMKISMNFPVRLGQAIVHVWAAVV
jgi:hypothetical protein